MSQCSGDLFRLLLASTLMLPFSSILAFASDDAGPTVDRDSSNKKIYKNIPLGPFRFDLDGSILLCHEYQSGFDCCLDDSALGQQK